MANVNREVAALIAAGRAAGSLQFEASAHSAPFCIMQLGDLGADVVKELDI